MEVISLNCWFLRVPLFGGKSITRRRRLLLNELRRMNADVVCLQEIWHGCDATYLTKELMALGYQCSWHRVGAFGSGLFIATKGKHNSLRFEATRAKARGAEKFITKGALSIEVAEIAGRRTSRLRIVNVHLGAAVNPKDREGDLERVLAFANCDLKPTEGIILCGDFAFDPHDRVEHARLSAPYRHIVEEYGFTDVLPRRKAGDFPTMLVENPWALPEWRGSSIDYIFYRGALFDGCDRATVCLDQPIHSGKGQALYLSDHAAVFAKLVLKG